MTSRTASGRGCPPSRKLDQQRQYLAPRVVTTVLPTSIVDVDAAWREVVEQKDHRKYYGGGLDPPGPLGLRHPRRLHSVDEAGITMVIVPAGLFVRIARHFVGR